MRWSEIPFHPSERTLRQFALLWIGFFLLLAGWQGILRERHFLGSFLAVLALTIGPLGIIWPRVLRPIYVGWLIAVFPIGWLVSRLILGLLFFGLFTLVAMVFRVLGRDPLRRRPQPDVTSYWRKKLVPADVRSYFNQS